MVNDGIENVKEIQRGLQSYVVHDLFKNAELPAKTNRRFFPTLKDIHNHYFNAFSKMKLAKIDQANVYLLIESWKENFC